MKIVTVEQVLSWGPCGWNGKHDGRNYTRQRITELFDGRDTVTALDVINMDIPDADILWAVLGPAMLSDRTRRIASCAFAASVLPIFEDKHPGDSRPRVAIETGYKYALGEATEEELKAAAARAAGATKAAEAAARAAWDAEDADLAAAWAAFWAAGAAEDAARWGAGAARSAEAAEDAARWGTGAAWGAYWAARSAERELQVLLLHDIIMEWEAGNEGRNG